MPLISYVRQLRNYHWIIEDPDPEKNRIFIENQSYNVDDLSGRMGEDFYFTYTNGTYTWSGDSANWYDWPVVITNGKYGNSWADSRQAWPAGAGKWDPWILSLDYNIVPKRIWYNQKDNLVYMFYPRDITTDNMRQDVRISKDLTEPIAMCITTQNDWIYVLYQRDDGTLVGFNRENNINYVAVMDFQYAETDQTPASIEIANVLGTTNIINFFIGTDENKTKGYFLYYNCGTHDYEIHEQGDFSNNNGNVGFAGRGGDGLLLSIGTGGFANICYQFPSNISRLFGDIWIFYSSHWDASGILSPKLIRWDKSSMVFTVKECSMVYPGTTAYSDYGAPPTSNNFTANTASNWWMKPHLFTVPGTLRNFITFCTIEKCIQYYYSERWNASQQQRNWITYEINDADPSILTYHSHIEWPNTWEFPRSWVPVNDSGDQILVMLNGRTVLYQWDVTNGWTATNTQSIDARAYGIDSTGRIYLVTRALAGSRRTGGTADAWLGGYGYNATYTFDKNTPYNVRSRLVQGDGDTKSLKFEVDSTTYVIAGEEGIFPVVRRGNTYKIDVSSIDSSHPLAIRYSDGDTTQVYGAPPNNAATGAYQTTFDLYIPYDAPNTLVYQCVNHSYMIGTLNVVDAPPNENVIKILNPGFDYQVVGYQGSYPTIVLRRGVKYVFDLSDVLSSHKFAIRYSFDNTTPVKGVKSTNALEGDSSSYLNFNVPYDAPNDMVYQCVFHGAIMRGRIRIMDAEIEVSVDNKKDFGITTDTAIHKFFTPEHPFQIDNPKYYSWNFDRTDRLWTSNHDDFNFRLDDFTVEFWLWSRGAWSSQSNTLGVVGQKMGDNPYQGWQIYRNSAQTLKMAVRYAGNTDFYSTEDVAANTWAHWALVRHNGTMYWYKDGIQCGSVDASTSNIYDTTADFHIAYSQTWGQYFDGLLSNLRICKGLAVYTGNFSVPTEPLKSFQSADTNISAITDQCVLLTCQNNDLMDNSGFKSINLRASSDDQDVQFIQQDLTESSTLDFTTDSSGPSKIKFTRSAGDDIANIKISAV